MDKNVKVLSKGTAIMICCLILLVIAALMCMPAGKIFGTIVDNMKQWQSI